MDTGRSATRDDDDDDDGEERCFLATGEAWHAHPGAHAFRAAATPRQSESVDATVDIVGAVRARAGASETECEAARRREARRRCVEWSALTMTLFSAITRRANNATQRNAEILRSALLRTAPRAPTATMAPT
jgi:hypothetical protein